MFTTLKVLDQKAQKIHKILQKVNKTHSLGIYIKPILIKKKMIPNSRLNLAILDLECTPPKIAGFFFHGFMFQFICHSPTKITYFNVILAEVLRILDNTLMFTFSERERRFIHGFLPHLLTNVLKNRDFSYLEELRIINLQRSIYESLVAALISIGEKPAEDPLLRDSKRVNEHYDQGHFDMLLAHNKSCLLSTLKLVQKRFLIEKLW